MNQQSLESKKPSTSSPKAAVQKNGWLKALAFLAWGSVAFLAVNFLISGLILLENHLNIDFLNQLSQPVQTALFSVLVYSLTIVTVIGLPYWILHKKTSLRELGINQWPSWSALGLAPLALVIYFIVSGVVTYLIAVLLPSFDLNQAQDVGFNYLGAGYEFGLAFFCLVVLAPIAEEVLFRGYLYGKIKALIPTWAAILLVSLLFGLAHGQWNVAILTFILSIFLCLLRDISGNLWSSVFLHMLKNGLAFFLLYASPFLLNSLGG